MKRNIVSIQSQVMTGYVGNSCARLPIQLHGFEPVEIPTVLLSNHIEYQWVLGGPTPLDLFKELLRGIENNKIIDASDYVISGYVTDTALIECMAEYIGRNKKRLGFTFVYDPVYGDYRAGGLYIPKVAADLSKQLLLPICDIVMPNHFELEYILGTKAHNTKLLLELIQKNSVLKSKTIVVTGAQLEDTPKDQLEVLLYKEGKIQRFQTPMLEIQTLGTGDLFTATMVSQMNSGKDIENAIKVAIKYLHETLVYSMEHRYKEFTSETMVNCRKFLFE